MFQILPRILIKTNVWKPELVLHLHSHVPQFSPSAPGKFSESVPAILDVECKDINKEKCDRTYLCVGPSSSQMYPTNHRDPSENQDFFYI